MVACKYALSNCITNIMDALAVLAAARAEASVQLCLHAHVQQGAVSVHSKWHKMSHQQILSACPRTARCGQCSQQGSVVQIPVLLPEKLSMTRCLLEVEDGTSTDLAGDAGAVGRFGIIKEDNQQQAQLDLKGQT